MSEKKKLKIGIMGGGMGAAHAKGFMALSDYAVVTAVCETNPELYSRFDGRVQPDTKFYTDFDEFIHSGIDAVMLANYFHEHAKYAIKAFEAGAGGSSNTVSVPSRSMQVTKGEAFSSVSICTVTPDCRIRKTKDSRKSWGV